MANNSVYQSTQRGFVRNVAAFGLAAVLSTGIAFGGEKENQALVAAQQKLTEATNELNAKRDARDAAKTDAEKAAAQAAFDLAKTAEQIAQAELSSAQALKNLADLKEGAKPAPADGSGSEAAPAVPTPEDSAVKAKREADEAAAKAKVAEAAAKIRTTADAFYTGLAAQGYTPVDLGADLAQFNEINTIEDALVLGMKGQNLIRDTVGNNPVIQRKIMSAGVAVKDLETAMKGLLNIEYKLFSKDGSLYIGANTIFGDKIVSISEPIQWKTNKSLAGSIGQIKADLPEFMSSIDAAVADARANQFAAADATELSHEQLSKYLTAKTELTTEINENIEELHKNMISSIRADKALDTDQKKAAVTERMTALKSALGPSGLTETDHYQTISEMNAYKAELVKAMKAANLTYKENATPKGEAKPGANPTEPAKANVPVKPDVHNFAEGAEGFAYQSVTPLIDGVLGGALGKIAAAQKFASWSNVELGAPEVKDNAIIAMPLKFKVGEETKEVKVTDAAQLAELRNAVTWYTAAMKVLVPLMDRDKNGVVQSEEDGLNAIITAEGARLKIDGAVDTQVELDSLVGELSKAAPAPGATSENPAAAASAWRKEYTAEQFTLMDGSIATRANFMYRAEGEKLEKVIVSADAQGKVTGEFVYAKDGKQRTASMELPKENFQNMNPSTLDQLAEAATKGKPAIEAYKQQQETMRNHLKAVAESKEAMRYDVVTITAADYQKLTDLAKGDTLLKRYLRGIDGARSERAQTFKYVLNMAEADRESLIEGLGVDKLTWRLNFATDAAYADIRAKLETAKVIQARYLGDILFKVPKKENGLDDGDLFTVGLVKVSQANLKGSEAYLLKMLGR